jgi:hypothetical protein
MLLPDPVLRVLEQVSAQSLLFGLEPFDLRSDVGQAVSRMTVLHEHPPYYLR